MKALTVLQPWACAIAHARKFVENRTWPPPASVIGERIAIHAGKRFDKEGWNAGLANPKLVGPDAWVSYHDWLLYTSPKFRGVVMAVATIDGIARCADDAQDSPWFFGPYGWILQNIQPVKEPVPCRGAQGLWELPKDVEIEVLKNLSEVSFCFIGGMKVLGKGL